MKTRGYITQLLLPASLYFVLHGCAPSNTEYSDNYYTEYHETETTTVRFDYDLENVDNPETFISEEYDVAKLPLVVEAVVSVAMSKGYLDPTISGRLRRIPDYFSSGHIIYTDRSEVLNDYFTHYATYLRDAKDEDGNAIDHSETFAAFIMMDPKVSPSVSDYNYLILIDKRDIHKADPQNDSLASQKVLEGVIIHELTHVVSDMAFGEVDHDHSNPELWQDFRMDVMDELH